MLGVNFDRAVRRLNQAGLGVGEHRPALQHPHLGAHQQGRDAAHQAVDDAVLPGDGPAEIERRWCRDRDAERVAAHRSGHRREPVGRVDQRL